ncbi:MAG: dephospho-CoA kinase, partial [candidate division WOR-3 bacterium]
IPWRVSRARFGGVVLARVKIAITGNTGSGKSTVAELLKKRGIPVLDADAMAHEIISMPEILEKIKAEFGPDFITSRGLVDRKRLGREVFSDPARLRRLNAIMRPKIAFMVGKAMDEAPGEFVAVDGALVFEYGLEGLFDRVVVVVSDPDEMIRRSASKTGYSEDDVRKIFSAQIPQEEKARKAWFVIENKGSLDDLESQVDELVARLRSGE